MINQNIKDHKVKAQIHIATKRSRILFNKKLMIPDKNIHVDTLIVETY